MVDWVTEPRVVWFASGENGKRTATTSCDLLEEQLRKAAPLARDELRRWSLERMTRLNSYET